MIINGKERGFALTVGASVEISEYCPSGDLQKIGELFSLTYGKQIRSLAKIIAALSRGYEAQRHFEDPAYVPDALTVEQILALGNAEFKALAEEAFAAFRRGMATEVELAPSKKGIADE